jgi:hypothetical protein
VDRPHLHPWPDQDHEQLTSSSPEGGDSSY